MRVFFVGLFAVMAAISIFMAKWSAPASHHGKTPVVWTSDANPLRTVQVNLFNRLHPDLELVLDPANETMDKVIVQSMGGVGPDLFDCRDANQLSAYVRAGIALDVTDDLQHRGVDVKAQTWKAMHPLAIFEGRTYGVPTNIGANALWVHDDLLKREGVTLPPGPWTWEQFIPIAQKLTHRDAQGKILQAGLIFDGSYLWTQFVYGFGGRVFSKNGTSCTLDSPEVIRAVQLMQDLIYKYKVTPTPVEEGVMAGQGGWGSTDINLFGAKRAAMAIGGRWWLANLRTFKELHLRAVESPTGGVRQFSTTGRATLVNANSPHRQAALEFLAFMGLKEYNELINDQADGVCAFKEFAQGQKFLYNPEHPEEKDNEIWRAASDLSVPSETSPYVNGTLVDRIIQRQLDLVKIKQKTAAEAMRDAAKEINEQIREKLKGDT